MIDLKSLVVFVRRGSFALFVALAVGCQVEEQREPRPWADVTDSTAVRQLVDSRSICNGCIRLEEVVTIGDMDGPGYLASNTLGYHLRNGTYWVGQAGSINVYDPEGHFLRQVGRAGEGPMEFKYANPVYEDSAGNIHVVDLGIPRITIIKPDLTLDRTILLPSTANSVAPLPGGRYVMNMSIGTRQAIGQPLHVVNDSGRVVHSFGDLRRDATPAVGPGMRRILTTDRDSRIFAVHQNQYLIDVWTDSGRRIVGYEGPALNPYEERPPGPLTPDNPPESRVMGIYLDQAERLWVASLRVREDWFERSEEVVLPDGRKMLQPQDEDQSSWLVGRIEIIDLNRAEIVARRDFDEQLMTFIGEGLIIGPRLTTEGVPQLGVWRLTYEGSSE